MRLFYYMMYQPATGSGIISELFIEKVFCITYILAIGYVYIRRGGCLRVEDRCRTVPEKAETGRNRRMQPKVAA